MPDIREGDTLQPGMPVADVLDLSELEVWTKIGELDRANLKEGQDALLQLDAIPDKQFRGKIKAMSGTATSDVFSGDPSKKFDVVFSIDMRQLLTGAGHEARGRWTSIMATAAANAKKIDQREHRRSFFAGCRPRWQGPDAAGAMAGGMAGGAGYGGNRRHAGRGRDRRTRARTRASPRAGRLAGATRGQGGGGQGGQAGQGGQGRGTGRTRRRA